MSSGTHHSRSNQDKLTFRQTLSALRLLFRLLIQKKTRRSVIEYSKNFFREKDASPLHEAAKNGRVRKLRRLLAMGEDADFVKPGDADRITPLMAAAGSRVRRSNEKVCRVLLRSGANPNAVDKYGRTALFYALDQNKTAIVRELLDWGADIAHSSRAAKPIHIAAQRADTECIRLLVAHGANVNESTGSEMDAQGPLHFAARVGNVEGVRVLLELGANVNGVKKQGSTPLIDAIVFRRPDCVALLLEHGADLRIAEQWGDLPIHFAAIAGNPATLRLLLERKVDVDSIGQTGMTPLMRAAASGHLDCCSILIQQGANVDALDAEQRTLLMHAAYSGKAVVIRLFLELGASIDAQDVNGATALFGAAHSGSLEAVELLLAAGANPTIRNRYNKLAQSCVEERSSQRTMIEGALHRAQDAWSANEAYRNQNSDSDSA